MRRVGVDGIGQGVSDDVVLVRRRPGIFRTPARTCADPSGWWTGDQSRQHRPRVRQVVDVGCARHFSSPLESETTLGCAAADRAVVEGPEGELGHWVSQCRCQSKALVDCRIQRPRPGERVPKSSSWAGCLGIGRATADQARRAVGGGAAAFRQVPPAGI